MTLTAARTLTEQPKVTLPFAITILGSRCLSEAADSGTKECLSATLLSTASARQRLLSVRFGIGRQRLD